MSKRWMYLRTRKLWNSATCKITSVQSNSIEKILDNKTKETAVTPTKERTDERFASAIRETNRTEEGNTSMLKETEIVYKRIPVDENNVTKRDIKQMPLHILYSRKVKKVENSDTTYYFEDGLRKVYPYFFTFRTFCKETWHGKSLLEILRENFRKKPIERYEQMRKSKTILLNQRPIESLHVKVKQNNMITSKVHLHEAPVTAQKIEIVTEDDNFLIVNKPASIPMHSTGCYRLNSLCLILRLEFGYKGLRICHRLDRLTSGLVIFAKNKHTAAKVMKAISSRNVQKEYLCRVVGEFPHTHESHGIVCNQPVTRFNKNMGCCAAWEVEGFQSKEASTEFHRISTDGETSIVLCKPRTGRMHQIRVHLQYLGYPIANDPMYNHEAWGEERFKYGPCSKHVHDVAYKISRVYENDPFKFKGTLTNEENSITEQRSDNVTSNSDNNTESENFTPFSNANTHNQNTLWRIGETVFNQRYSPNCDECQYPPDFSTRWLSMDLHAYRYKGPDWEFKTPLPDWAKQSANRQ